MHPHKVRGLGTDLTKTAEAEAARRAAAGAAEDATVTRLSRPPRLMVEYMSTPIRKATRVGTVKCTRLYDDLGQEYSTTGHEAGAFGGRFVRREKLLEDGGVDAAPLRAEPEGRLLSWPAETVYEYE